MTPASPARRRRDSPVRTPPIEFPFQGSDADWSDWSAFGIAVTDGVATLAREDRLTYREPVQLVGARADDPRVVDVAVAACGTVYLLAESGDVFEYDPDRESLRRRRCLWTGDDAGEPAAIAVTADTVFVAGRAPGDGTGAAGAEPTGRVQAISRHVSSTRWILTAPFDRPRAMAALDDDVYVLDAGPRGTGDAEPGSLVRLPAGEPDPTTVVDGLSDPRDVDAGDDRRLYVLDGEGPTVRAFVPDEADFDPDAGPVALPEGEGLPPAAFATDAGTAVAPNCLAVAGPTEVVVGVAASAAGERLLYRYRPPTGPDAASQPGRLEPLPAFQRGCHRLVLQPHRRGRPTTADGADDAGGQDGPDGTDGDDDGRSRARRLYAVDDGDRGLYALTAARAVRGNRGGAAPYLGRLVGRLDAGETGTEWHRVTVAATLAGSGTQFRLRYYATDDGTLDMDGFRTVTGIGEAYADYLTEVNVPGLAGLATLDAGTVATITGAPPTTARSWVAVARDRAARWRSYDRPNPEDVLLEGAVGRYLWVELELVGEAFAAPRVDELRAYFPRQSYLRYLPAIYREDATSAAFLERFLSLFESAFVTVDEELSAFTRFLDPRGAPAEYLAWLGGWLAVGQEEAWPAAARRRLLVEAPSLFKQRGTAAGLLAVLDVYLDAVVPRHTDEEWEATWARLHEREAAWLDEQVAAGRLTAAERDAALAAHDALADVYRPGPRRHLLTFADEACLRPSPALDAYRRLVRCPQCFLVLVTPQVTDRQLRSVRRIVDDWSPAHATGRAAPLRAELRLGGNGLLGVNTTLSDPEFVLEDALLGTDSVLGGRELHGQLGFASRLDEDATLS